MRVCDIPGCAAAGDPHRIKIELSHPPLDPWRVGTIGTAAFSPDLCPVHLGTLARALDAVVPAIVAASIDPRWTRGDGTEGAITDGGSFVRLVAELSKAP